MAFSVGQIYIENRQINLTRHKLHFQNGHKNFNQQTKCYVLRHCSFLGVITLHFSIRSILYWLLTCFILGLYTVKAYNEDVKIHNIDLLKITWAKLENQIQGFITVTNNLIIKLHQVIIHSSSLTMWDGWTLYKLLLAWLTSNIYWLLIVILVKIFGKNLHFNRCWYTLN